MNRAPLQAVISYEVAAPQQPCQALLVWDVSDVVLTNARGVFALAADVSLRASGCRGPSRCHRGWAPRSNTITAKRSRRHDLPALGCSRPTTRTSNPSHPPPPRLATVIPWDLHRLGAGPRVSDLNARSAIAVPPCPEGDQSRGQLYSDGCNPSDGLGSVVVSRYFRWRNLSFHLSPPSGCSLTGPRSRPDPKARLMVSRLPPCPPLVLMTLHTDSHQLSLIEASPPHNAHQLQDSF